MKKLHTTALLLVLVLALVALCAPARVRADEPAPVAIGATVEDFTLPDAAGRPVSLAGYRGKKPVVLVFYRGYW